MSLLNFTLVEFLAILLPLSGMLVALYFYDRSRRRRIVSTLRFWPRHATPPMTTRRKKLQQPLSLLLQLLALLLLLLAIADWRFGGDGGQPRHHVVILETSAWMNAANSGPGGGTLMDVARARALAYLRAIPSRDAVMIIRADAVPTPATSFTTDRKALEAAISESSPGWTAPYLAGALEAARSSLQLAAGSPETGPAASADLAASETVGEIAYIGSGRIQEGERDRIRTSGIPFLRFIEAGETTRDIGIRRFAARPMQEDPSRWHVVAEVYNYDAEPRPLRVDFSFDERLLGNRSELIPPRSSLEIAFNIRTQREGVLQAVLASEDDFEGNNSARLRLPGFKPRLLRAYSSQPDRLRALMTSTAALKPEFLDPGRYSAAPEGPLSLFDGFAPQDRPGGIYFDPPATDSPVTVSRVVRGVRVTTWATDHPVAEGLRNKDLVLEQTSVFELGPEDTPIAETDAGPVIVARSSGGVKSVVFGFHPATQGVENRLTTPLLFANTLRWFMPDVFRSAELRTGPPGMVETNVAAEGEEDIEISSPENPGMPWRLAGDRLRFFAGRPGSVRVRTPHQESHFTLTLPEVGSARWDPPAGTRRGVPPPVQVSSPEHFELWPWLTLAAAACLLLEWKLYGQMAPSSGQATSFSPSSPASAGQIFSGLETPEHEVHETEVSR